jgi:Cdc6-like AAA superfamily ATPase
MTSTSTSVMIGRDAELAELTEAFEATATAGPRLAIVGGEAGIGKTTLARDLARQARDAGALVVPAFSRPAACCSCSPTAPTMSAADTSCDPSSPNWNATGAPAASCSSGSAPNARSS